ncbi:MAG: hypothetical protein H9533_11315 [Rhodobacteraceae bacterium]|nr:hypothetical protein [Paracoccaceae bacterium]
MPGVDFTITPVSELCPDRATAELMTLTAKLGALMPYRAVAEVLAEFLPGQTPPRHTTPRHRTLAVGKRLEEKEEQRMFFVQVDTQERRQCELPLPQDPEREFVLSIDTDFPAHPIAPMPRLDRNRTRFDRLCTLGN